MISYKGIKQNLNFILCNINYLSYDDCYEFNNFVNYFVDKVISSKYTNLSQDFKHKDFNQDFKHKI